MTEATAVSTGESAETSEITEPERLKPWLEAALLAAGQPLTLNQLNALFPEAEQPGHGPIREALALLDAELSDRAVELVEVAGGYRLQIRSALMAVVSNLWAEKPPRYSRALLETLAIIAYRQPITRGEIEQIRGVSLSTNILKTLQEREWIKVVGHRDIPGKPELLGTTKSFLDYFGLKGLDDLPTLAEIRDLDNIEPELDLGDPEQDQAADHEQSAQAETEPRLEEETQPHEHGYENQDDPAGGQESADIEGTEGDGQTGEKEDEPAGNGPDEGKEDSAEEIGQPPDAPGAESKEDEQDRQEPNGEKAQDADRR